MRHSVVAVYGDGSTNTGSKNHRQAVDNFASLVHCGSKFVVIAVHDNVRSRHHGGILPQGTTHVTFGKSSHGIVALCLVYKLQSRQDARVVHGVVVSHELPLVHHASLTAITLATGETTLVISGSLLRLMLFLDSGNLQKTGCSSGGSSDRCENIPSAHR